MASVQGAFAFSLIDLGYKIPISNVTGSENGKEKKNLIAGMKPGELSVSEQCRNIRVVPFFVSSLV